MKRGLIELLSETMQPQCRSASCKAPFPAIGHETQSFTVLGAQKAHAKWPAGVHWMYAEVSKCSQRVCEFFM